MNYKKHKTHTSETACTWEVSVENMNCKMSKHRWVYSIKMGLCVCEDVKWSMMVLDGEHLWALVNRTGFCN